MKCISAKRDWVALLYLLMLLVIVDSLSKRSFFAFVHTCVVSQPYRAFTWTTVCNFCDH
eukprot:m.375710 g.375710  ORF g.375710 m.375710 type:complete len:59 (+) comp78248_c0_seq1:43-219(+)